MYFHSFSLAVLAPLAAIVSATSREIHPRGQPAPASTRCYTHVAGSPAGHIPSTAWHNHYTYCTLTFTETFTTTHTPRTKSTVTSTVTSTISEALTVSAPAAFIPVQSSLPDSSYSGTDGGSDGGAPSGKRQDRMDLFAKRGIAQSLCPARGKPRYPQGVTCNIWTHNRCATKVVTSTKTVIAQTSTKLITTTTTTSSTTYTTTVYAACATNNFANTYLGQSIGEVTGGFSSVYDTNTTDAYDCCVAAITLADTSVWAFEPNPFQGEGANCFIGQTGGSCPAPGANPSTSESGFGDLVVGNAYCGEIAADIPIASSAPPAVRRTAVPIQA